MVRIVLDLGQRGSGFSGFTFAPALQDSPDISLSSTSLTQRLRTSGSDCKHIILSRQAFDDLQVVLQHDMGY
jgi:hypothetical protein